MNFFTVVHVKINVLGTLNVIRNHNEKGSWFHLRFGIECRDSSERHGTEVISGIFRKVAVNYVRFSGNAERVRRRVSTLRL